MKSNRYFVDAIAGAGKTTKITLMASGLSRAKSSVLILSYQKGDRIPIIKKLLQKGFKVEGSLTAGITKLTKFGHGTVYVSNLHALAYKFFVDALEGQSVTLVNESAFFWKLLAKRDKSWRRNFNVVGNGASFGDVVYQYYQLTKWEDEEVIKESGLNDFYDVYVEKFFSRSIAESLQKFKEDYEELKSFLSQQTGAFVIDYDDVIYQLPEIVDLNVDYVLVDEAQDWKVSWFKVLDEAFKDSTIIAFGDTNQALFITSGGMINYGETMKKLGFKELKDESVRTTKRTYDGGYEEALPYQNREKEHEYVRLGLVEVKTVDVEEFVEKVSGDRKRGLILTRTNAKMGKLHGELKQKGLFVLSAKLYHLWEAMKAWFYYDALRESDAVRFEHVEPFLKPKFVKTVKQLGLTEVPFSEVLKAAETDTLSVIDDKILNFLTEEVDPIAIMTVHAAKGKEADYVLVNDETASEKSVVKFIRDDYVEFENPVRYVARTRHRDLLYFNSK